MLYSGTIATFTPSNALGSQYDYIPTLGTTSHFEGIILSKSGITFKTGAFINGRGLAQSAVIPDKNIVTQP